jgi:hypothetical protein
MEKTVRYIVESAIDPKSMEYIPESYQKKVMIKNSDGTLTESLQEIKHWKIRGPFIMAEKKNRNGRFYPGELVEREIQKYNEEYINPGISWGCLGHPPTPNTDESKISHYISELKWDSHAKVGVGELVITNGPVGLQAASCFEEPGRRLCVSTRGTGSLSSTGRVNEDWNLLAVDLVHVPGGQDCMVNAIYESKQWVVSLNENNQRVFSEFENNLKKHGTRNLGHDLMEYFSKIKV